MCGDGVIALAQTGRSAAPKAGACHTDWPPADGSFLGQADRQPILESGREPANPTVFPYATAVVDRAPIELSVILPAEYEAHGLENPRWELHA